MAVGAHADDIEFSVGGTLLKYRDRGYEVVYVMATNNMSGIWNTLREDGTVDQKRHPPEIIMPRRKVEAEAGAAALGTVPIHLDHPQRHYNGPNGECIELRYGCEQPGVVPPDVPSILTAHEDETARRTAADLILEHDPECIVTHGLVQQDMEHVGTCLLITKAYWDAVERGYAGGLLHWRVGFTHCGSLNMRWDTFIDITGHLQKKLEIGGLHECQCPRPFRPDSPIHHRALAYGTACGCDAAETYVIVNTGKVLPQYRDFTVEILGNRR